MIYTKEQLAGMSDNEIDAAVHKTVSNIDWYMTPEDPRNSSGKWMYGKKKAGVGAMMSLPNYCTDWSATGPLMVEYGVALQFENGIYDHAFDSNDGVTTKASWDKNPLRAICEVILMMGEGK